MKEDGSSICGFEGMIPKSNNLSYSSIAQSVERAAVNRVVVGSSPTRGVKELARWLSWLERRPVTAEVEGSNPFRVVACEYPSTHDASVIKTMGS